MSKGRFKDIHGYCAGAAICRWQWFVNPRIGWDAKPHGLFLQSLNSLWFDHQRKQDSCHVSTCPRTSALWILLSLCMVNTSKLSITLFILGVRNLKTTLGIGKSLSGQRKQSDLLFCLRKMFEANVKLRYLPNWVCTESVYSLPFVCLWDLGYIQVTFQDTWKIPSELPSQDLRDRVGVLYIRYHNTWKTPTKHW